MFLILLIERIEVQFSSFTTRNLFLNKIQQELFVKHSLGNIHEENERKL